MKKIIYILTALTSTSGYAVFTGYLNNSLNGAIQNHPVRYAALVEDNKLVCKLDLKKIPGT